MQNKSQQFLSFSQKIFIVIAVLTTTFLFSTYQKNIYDQFVNKAPSLILKEMPEFEAVEIGTKEIISKNTFLKASNGVLVHFWGTWCAPCEAELPSFMDFARSLEFSGVKVFILAVNDKEKDVKKFLKRFKSNRPKNVLFGLDKDGATLPVFGSVKVPETYLFGSNLRHLEKFIGPQDWSHPSYKDRVLRLLKSSTKKNKKVIESH